MRLVRPFPLPGMMQSSSELMDFRLTHSEPTNTTRETPTWSVCGVHHAIDKATARQFERIFEQIREFLSSYDFIDRPRLGHPVDAVAGGAEQNASLSNENAAGLTDGKKPSVHVIIYDSVTWTNVLFNMPKTRRTLEQIGSAPEKASNWAAFAYIHASTQHACMPARLWRRGLCMPLYHLRIR